MADVYFSFIYTTQDKYDVLKQNNTLKPGGIYFISDTQRIYRGSELMGANNVKVVNNINEIGNAIPNVLYIVQGDSGKYELYSLTDSGLIKVGGVPEDLDLSIFAEGIIVNTIDETNADNNTIATTAAITGYVKGIQKAISDEVSELDGAFTDVSVGESSDGSTNKFGLVFTKHDGTTKTIDLQKEAFAESAVLRKDEANNKTYLDITVVNGDVVSVDLTELIDIADATTVKTTQKITLTTDWGNLKSGDVIDASTDLQQILLDALSQDIYPTATNPKITSISLTGAGVKEIGTEFTPSYTVNLSNPFGSYSCSEGSKDAVASGCSVSKYNVSDTAGNTGTTKTGSFDKFTVESDTNYKVSATVEYTEGDMPITYLGNEHESARIDAGTTPSVSSSAVTGERFIFYGTKLASSTDDNTKPITDPKKITSAQVRALGKSNKASSGFPSKITLPTDCKQVFFACPTGVDTVSGVLNSANQAPFGTVEKVTGVEVEGANGYEAVTYDVYYISNAGGTSSSAEFTVKA